MLLQPGFRAGNSHFNAEVCKPIVCREHPLYEKPGRYGLVGTMFPCLRIVLRGPVAADARSLQQFEHCYQPTANFFIPVACLTHSDDAVRNFNTTVHIPIWLRSQWNLS